MSGSGSERRGAWVHGPGEPRTAGPAPKAIHFTTEIALRCPIFFREKGKEKREKWEPCYRPPVTAVCHFATVACALHVTRGLPHRIRGWGGEGVCEGPQKVQLCDTGSPLGTPASARAW